MSLCECGCGQETKTHRGKPNRFILGHNRRDAKISNPMKDRINTEGITQDIVKELFDYIDSELYWKESWTGRKIGNIAGTISKGGYRTIGICDKIYSAHRLIFLYHHGYLPQFLDHIDGNKLNNRINNIREATIQENGMNQKKHKSMNGKPTTSIYKGVSWDKRVKKWISAIRIAGKSKNLGGHTSEIDAALAYNRAATKYYGEFARLNIIRNYNGDYNEPNRKNYKTFEMNTMKEANQIIRIEAVIAELESIENDYDDYTYEIECAIRNLLPITDEDSWGE